MAVPPIPGIWNWPNPLPDSEFDGELALPDYAGYKVVANDGEIGHIDSFAIAPDEAHLVIDTGGWLFGRMSLIPAAAVRVVNHDSKTSRSTSPSSRSRTRPSSTTPPATAPTATPRPTTTAR